MRVSNLGTSRGPRPRWQSAMPALRGAALATLSFLALPSNSQAQLTVDGATLWRQGAGGLQGTVGEDYRFGSRLATGDFNGDGHPDVAATAPLADVDGVAQAGAVHIVYGGAGGLSPDVPDDQILALGTLGLPGETWSGEQFGLGGVATGDFDGDGFDDLAVASTFDVVEGKGGVGSLLVVHGGPGGLDPADALYIPGNGFPLPANVATRRFGHALTTGDFDGDGFDDLAVSHRAYLDGVEGVGVVHVFYGSEGSLITGPTVQAIHQGAGGVPGTPEEFDLFGSSLASGDFDGDGFDDLAIGAVGDGKDAPGAKSSGSVTVVFGGDDGLDTTTSVQWIRDLVGEQTSFPQFGQRVASGDFDGDGFDDLVATDPYEDVDGVLASGAVWVRHGGAEGFGPAQRLVAGKDPLPVEPEAYMSMGQLGIAVGDFDGDGRDDLAYSRSPYGLGVEEFEPGWVAVLYGGDEGFDGARSQLFSPATEGMPGEETDQLGFGAALAAADLDRDGGDDLIVGVPFQTVDGAERAGAFIVLPGVDPSGCKASDTTHCLQGGRFRVEVTFQAPGEAPAAARTVPAVADDSGLFWFFAETNWELQVKVLDGCALNGSFWVFSAATTDVAYTMTVTDTETGEVRDYPSPAGAAQALADTSAFATCLPGDGAPAEPTVIPPGLSADACPEKADELCLHGGRFQLSVEWTAGGSSGAGTVVPFGTADSGLFWFFEPDNWELLVKVLDGCALNGHFWVFAAATTDVEYRLRVFDRVTKTERIYENPPGVLATAVTDTEAFAGCS
jgi:hypothetical protein